MEFQQVISIGLDGSISGLERKNGLDLKQFGPAEIERTSEVIWDKEQQKWYVNFRHTNPPQILRHNLWSIVRNYSDILMDDPIVYFDTYDDGVAAEIKTLDYLRLNGLLPCDCPASNPENQSGS